jgi:hypothetical protein
MRKFKRAAGLALASFALLSCATTGRAPSFDPGRAKVSILVARSSPGGDYPVPEECLGETVFCFRFPIWFTATTIERVFGDQPSAKSFRAVLYTHYDQPAADSVANPRLMLFLRSNGHSFAIEHMYESAFLRKDGSYVVPLISSSPISWLPCEMHGLRERIQRSDFVEDISLPAHNLDGEDIDGVFEIEDGAAVPLYGIAVDRIRTGLGRNHRKLSDFECSTEADD